MNMKIKTVLVTGGAGYVGAVLVPKMLARGYKVKVLDWYIYGDVFKPYQSNRNYIQIKGDLRDRSLVKEALKDTDAVIHLACISNDPSFELNPKLGTSINYDAMKILVDLSKKAGVQRFIFASSSSVYGVKKEKTVTEDLSLEPLTDYSKYKILSEQYILDAATGDFIVLVLRPATVCGYSPRMRLDLTVNMLTIQALVNGRITVFGGSQTRPNIHIEDITDLYVKTLNYPKRKIAGKIYNAGYENLAVMRIAKMVKKVLKNRNIDITISPTDDKRSYRISSEKIKRELGFIPKHSVEEAIADIKKAHEHGDLPNPLVDDRYYNIRTMKSLLNLRL
ncbi:UDP-glucose 4-epimerase [Candidatus Gottesmanbacteria bacterium RBG_16_43_7]|uniref:UDP-glucose 4-epimerase n=1 Tax=Candidatus Gottesmanbacteria bacterium RBG_16_43_7 TaxID=1798373 RepID=A0A1F5ZB55_9BACT|nr:MAG: UDP-glucose 4-epimerase [Candidatus Gottesmanbacteria bacterium RBG_16_43_7]